VEGAAGALALLGAAVVVLVGPRTSPTGDAAIICLAAVAALALGYAMGRCNTPDGGRAARLAFAVAALVVATWAVHDARLALIGNHFYDLQVYLAAGHHALAGQPVYLTAPLAALPASAADDFFLYPPPVIPFFELLAKLPYRLVSPAWLVGMAAAALLAFRLLGLSWRWSTLLLAFPPLAKGFESGNVASLLFLIMAAGFRFGPGVVAGSLFKVQSVIPVAWLVRERRWCDLVVGGLAVAALCAVSLPRTGIGAWHDWLAGLGYRAVAGRPPDPLRCLDRPASAAGRLRRRGTGRRCHGLLAARPAGPGRQRDRDHRGLADALAPRLRAGPASAPRRTRGGARLGGSGLWHLRRRRSMDPYRAGRRDPAGPDLGRRAR
jgi:hypothetical protein